jgi:hypothetical protein
MTEPPGKAYAAVGMKWALDSAIGLPSKSTSAARMLAFLMPADVRSNFMLPLLMITSNHAGTFAAGRQV